MTSNPFPATGPEDHGRCRTLAASTAAALCAASIAYAATLTAMNGWLGVVEAWLAWPTLTWLNVAVMLATLMSAWLSGREIARSSNGWRSPYSAVLAVSSLLCIVFVLSALIALIALVLLILLAGSDSDEESDYSIRLRRGPRQRHPPRHRNRRRRRSGPSSHRARRRRHW